MKNLTLILALMCISLGAFAQKKMLVRTFNPEKCSQIAIEGGNELKHEQWEKPSVRIFLNMDTKLPKKAIKYLVNEGHYKLEGNKIENVYVIKFSTPNDDILYNGKPILVNTTITAMVPPLVKTMDKAPNIFEKNEELIAGIAARGTKAETDAALAKMMLFNRAIESELSINGSDEAIPAGALTIGGKAVDIK